MSEEYECFTVVFEGDIRKLQGNPHKIESPFGPIRSIGVGDTFKALDAGSDDTSPTSAPSTLVAGIVPPHCSGYSFVLEPGVLHVKKDGSGYIAVDEEDFVLEDDRDGEGGSIHWIVRMDASEITALRDFLNGIPPRHVRVTEAMVNAADSVLSRRRPGIPDETIRLAITAALATTEGKDNG